MSHGVESNESVAVAATRPLAPVMEAVEADARRLRLRWRSDVNSRQDHYELRYARWPRTAAAADDFRAVSTGNTSATLDGLFPGAVYEVQVAALSNGLHSEWTTTLSPVRECPLHGRPFIYLTSGTVLKFGPMCGRAAGRAGAERVPRDVGQRGGALGGPAGRGHGAGRVRAALPHAGRRALDRRRRRPARRHAQRGAYLCGQYSHCGY